MNTRTSKLYLAFVRDCFFRVKQNRFTFPIILPNVLQNITAISARCDFYFGQLPQEVLTPRYAEYRYRTLLSLRWKPVMTRVAVVARDSYENMENGRYIDRSGHTRSFVAHATRRTDRSRGCVSKVYQNKCVCRLIDVWRHPRVYRAAAEIEGSR